MNLNFLSCCYALPPTAGYRVFASDFIFPKVSIDEARQRIESDCKAMLKTRFTHLTSSGTAAFYLILKALSRLTSARIVVIPAYTCPLVVLAIIRAGFQVQMCDTNGIDYNYDLVRLELLCQESKNIAAVVVTHFGGVPAEITQVMTIINNASTRIFMIEDATQSLGAKSNLQPIGSMGDFSFFSFGLGKGATLAGGGLLSTRHEDYGTLLINIIHQYEKPLWIKEISKIFEFLGYYICYRPSLLYWVYTLPQSYWLNKNDLLGALREYFTIEFPIYQVSNTRCYLGYNNFSRMHLETEQQRRLCSYYLEKMQDIPNSYIIQEKKDNQDFATYPFLSMIINGKRDLLFNDPEMRRLGVTRLFAFPLPEYPYLKQYFKNETLENYKNASHLSDNLLTLSTTSFITTKEIDQLADKIKSVMSNS